MGRWGAVIALGLMISVAHAQETKNEAATPPEVPAPQAPANAIELSIEARVLAAQKETDPEQKFRSLRIVRVEIARALEDVRLQRALIQDQLEKLQLERRQGYLFASAPIGRPAAQLDIDIEEAKRMAQLADEDVKKTSSPSADYDKKRETAEKWKNEVTRLEVEKRRSKATQEEYEKQEKRRTDYFDGLDKKIAALRAQDGALSKVQIRLGASQTVVDDEISGLLKTESQRNDFKKQIALAFTFLVGLVIVGFFAVSWHDTIVRQSIFSSESGIQFLTLFSVVIAIILFGITGILESKELAALLGGLSGYILGRVTSKDAGRAPPPAAA